MFTKRTYIPLTALLGLMLLLVAPGCGGDQSAGQGELFDDSRAGHDDVPGEHGEATHASTGDGSLDWCTAHSVPESECTQCHPELIDGFKERYDWCAGHGIPESHCRLCNPGISWPQEEILRDRRMAEADSDIAVSLFFRPNEPVCATNDALIQFASAQTADRAGLSVRKVRTDHASASVEAPAEVVFDETAATVVTSTVPALVSRWLVAPGDEVREGEVIALLQSPDVAELTARLLSTHALYQVKKKEVARHEELMSRQLISEQEYELVIAEGERARADFVSVRGLLRSAGLSEDDLDEIISHKKISNQFALRAPDDGVVVERTARLGDLMAAGQSFAQIADPSAMWIEAQLTEEQVRRVAVGEELTFSSDGRGLETVGGRVIWVSRLLDPHTRTGTVRAEIIAPDHDLSAGEFGRARIVKKDQSEVVLVPKDAVQWEGCCNVVFVKETADRYRPRKIEFRDGDGPFYQVTNGLERGEEVVVDGAFLLKTELKKTSIGAGCCGIEPVG